MGVHIFQGELRNWSMDEDEVVTQLAAYNTTFNTLLSICQQNTLAIQNLEKDMEIIKKNTSKDDDINGNQYSHLCILALISKYA